MQQKKRHRKNPKRTRRSVAKRIGFVIFSIFLVLLTTAIMCFGAFLYYINNYVKPEAQLDISSITMKFNSNIYYQNNSGEYKVLQTLKSDENREWAGNDKIPDGLKQAFVAIEDKRFYEHEGVDWKRTIGAAVNWVLPSGTSYGGSTITQQLIKNVTSDNDYSVKRKITEVVRALSLEQQVDKDTILELYMNVIYFGENAYGVQTASRTYFGKNVKKLDLAECAMIAGLTRNPSAYDPYRHPQAAKKRQKAVLAEMYGQGYITQTQYKEAVKEKLHYKNSQRKTKEGKVYSYFTDMVVSDVTNDLIKEKGYSKEYASAMVKSGGLSIYSTIDMDVQKKMDEVYTNRAYFPYATDDDGTAIQSAMMVLDPKTGNILGVEGGVGEKKESLTLNRATQTPRQPGSSIKPLSTYAPAIDSKLITPYSVVSDMPVFKLSDNPWPRNENRRYTGQMTIMDGVAKSTNTVAVQVMKKLTPDSAYDFMTKKLKFKHLDEDEDRNYGPMALGGLTYGATVREMAQGYTALANYGKFSKAKSYTKVVDANGNTILSHEDDKPKQVFKRSKSTPYYMNTLLKNAVDNGTGQLAKISGIDVAGKTGTTTDNNDRWFAGYTPYYVGVCWVGFDSSDDLPDLVPNPALSAWSQVMNRLHRDKASKSFKQPKNFVRASYCADSGMSPTHVCRSDPRGDRVKTGYYFKKDVPKKECNIHRFYNGMALMDLTRRFPMYAEVEDEEYTFRGANRPKGSGEEVSSPNGYYYNWYPKWKKAQEEAARRARQYEEAAKKAADSEGGDSETPKNEDPETPTDNAGDISSIVNKINDWVNSIE